MLSKLPSDHAFVSSPVQKCEIFFAKNLDLRKRPNVTAPMNYGGNHEMAEGSLALPEVRHVSWSPLIYRYYRYDSHQLMSTPSISDDQNI
ncbi:hypothetical protein ACLKA6_008171 [Drosophila palustris]